MSTAVYAATGTEPALENEEAWRLVLQASGEISRLAEFMLKTDPASDVDRAVHQAFAVRFRDLSNLICAASEGIVPTLSLEALGGLTR